MSIVKGPKDSVWGYPLQTALRRKRIASWRNSTLRPQALRPASLQHFMGDPVCARVPSSTLFGVKLGAVKARDRADGPQVFYYSSGLARMQDVATIPHGVE